MNPINLALGAIGGLILGGGAALLVCGLVGLIIWATRRQRSTPGGQARELREGFGAPEPPAAAGRSAVSGGALQYDGERLVGWQRYAPAERPNPRGPAAVAIAGAGAAGGAGGPGGPGAPPAAAALALTLSPNGQSCVGVAGGGGVYGLVALGLPVGSLVALNVTGLPPAGVDWRIDGHPVGAPIEAGRSYNLVLAVVAGTTRQTINFVVTGTAGAASAAVGGTLQIT